MSETPETPEAESECAGCRASTQCPVHGVVEDKGDLKPYTTMSQEAVCSLAKKLWAGKVFTSQHLSDWEDVSLCFMPLMFAEPGFRKWLTDNQIAVLWEDLDKASPRAINGRPMFFSMHCVNQSDWIRVLAELKTIEDTIGPFS